MDVRIGWATEFARQKYDYQADLDDLRLALLDGKIPEERLDEALASLSLGERVTLLNAIAGRYCEVAKLRLLGDELTSEQKKHIERAARGFMSEWGKVIHDLKARMGP